MSAVGSDPAEAGFTLIELLVGMALMLLIGGLVAPWYASIADQIRLRTALNAVVGDLRQARGTALRTGRPVSLAFDPAGRFYGLAGSGPWISLPSDIGLRWSGAGGVLGFFPDGTASGGELWLGGERQQLRLAIDPLTGAFAIAPRG